MSQDLTNTDDLVTVSVRVPRELADRLRLVAESEDRPVAAMLRRLIRTHVAASELEDAA